MRGGAGLAGAQKGLVLTFATVKQGEGSKNWLAKGSWLQGDYWGKVLGGIKTVVSEGTTHACKKSFPGSQVFL